MVTRNHAISGSALWWLTHSLTGKAAYSIPSYSTRGGTSLPARGGDFEQSGSAGDDRSARGRRRPPSGAQSATSLGSVSPSGSPSRQRSWFAWALGADSVVVKSYAAALAAVLSGLALAAPARADPSSINNEITFLKALSDKGIEFRETEDRATMIDRGYQFCRVLVGQPEFPPEARISPG